MDKLLAEWSSSEGIDSDDLMSVRQCLGNENHELWEFVSNLLSMKRCAERFEEDNDEYKLHDEQKQLKKNLQSQSIAVNQLESDISVVEKQIEELDETNRETFAKCNELTCKTQLLTMKSCQCQENIDTMNEYAKRLEQTEQSLQSQPKEKTYYATSTKNSDHSELESVVTKETRSCLEQVHVHQCLSDVSKTSSSSSIDLGEAKQEILTKVESLLRTYPCEELMQSLIELTQEDTSELTQLTNELNVSKEVENLRFTYDGELLREQRSPLQTVEDHIQEAQLQHLTASHNLIKSKREMKTAQSHLQDVIRNWERLVSVYYTPGSEEMSLIRREFNVNIELYGCESSLSEIDSLCSSMTHICQQKEVMVQSLKDKSKQIEELLSVMDKNQKEMQSIVKQNSTAIHGLLHQQNEVGVYIHRNIRSRKTNLYTLVIDLKDQLLNETNIFSCLSSHQMATCHSRSDCDELSLELGTHRHKVFARMLMNCSSKCPESIIMDLIEKLKTVKYAENRSEVTDKILCDMQKRIVDHDSAHAIVKKSEHFLDEHEGALLVMVTGDLSKASKAVASLPEVQCVMKEWWEQPAQSLVSWKYVDDMTIAQWLEQWKLLTPKL